MDGSGERGRHLLTFQKFQETLFLLRFREQHVHVRSRGKCKHNLVKPDNWDAWPWLSSMHSACTCESRHAGFAGTLQPSHASALSPYNRATSIHAATSKTGCDMHRRAPSGPVVSCVCYGSKAAQLRGNTRKPSLRSLRRLRPPSRS